MHDASDRDGEEQAAEQAVTASLLVIGDEILSGRTRDTNTGFIADALTAIGIRLEEVRVVPDRPARIVGALNALRAGYDYVFTTGGIGPTHDDITADAVASAFGVSIGIDPRAVAELRKRYAKDELTPARLRMARIPGGAELIENSVSRAPGFMIGNVIVMAGVPHIMQAMLAVVLPRLRHGAVMLSSSLRVERPEGDIAPVLAAAQAAYPGVAMGSYPFLGDDGRLGVNLVLRSTCEIVLETARTDLSARLAILGIVVDSAGPK